MPRVRLTPDTVNFFIKDLRSELTRKKVPNQTLDDILPFIKLELDNLFLRAKHEMADVGSQLVMDGNVEFSKQSSDEVSLEINPQDLEMLKGSIANCIMQEVGGNTTVDRGATPAPSKMRNTIANLIRKPIKITSKTKRTASMSGENPWRRAFFQTNLDGEEREKDAVRDEREAAADLENKGGGRRLPRPKPGGDSVWNFWRS